MNYIGNLVKRAKKGPLNILTCCTHETAESILAKCFPQHSWFALYHESVKTWNPTFRECPPNYFLLKNGIIPTELDIDAVLSQNKFGQFQLLAPIANRYRIPLISFEHTMTMPQWTEQQIQQLKNMKGDINLFITPSSRKAWGWSENEASVIEHAIDTDSFCPNPQIVKQPYILSVCNQFSRPVRHLPCGFPLWKEIIKPNTNESLPWKHLGADDPGFSLPAKNIDDLIHNYQAASVFINTSQYSPIPMSLLEAASVGTACVSTATCEIPNYFVHGETALLSNNPSELRYFCIELLKNDKLRKQLGDNARQMVKEKFNTKRYIEDWNKIFATLSTFN